MVKYLIFDSGALINFSTNSLLNIMRGLQKSFPGKFLVTHTIKHETVDYPLKVKRFEWGALRIQQLFNEKVLVQAEENVVDANLLRKKAQEFLEQTNNIFVAKNKPVHILDEGEAEVLALSKILQEKGNETVIVVDERTTRVLCERPENLQKLLTKKLHTEVKVDKSKFSIFEGYNVIRSTELAYIAYKKGFIQIKDKKALGAVIYGLKYGGCSISEKEAQAYKKLA